MKTRDIVLLGAGALGVGILAKRRNSGPLIGAVPKPLKVVKTNQHGLLLSKLIPV